MKLSELKRFALLQELSDEEREAVGGLLETFRLAPGETLFREGQEADGLLLVAAGRIALSAAGSDETGIVGPGSALGGMALVAVGTREASAECVKAALVHRLSREDYHRLAEDHPRVASRLVEAVALETAVQARAALAALVDPASKHL